MVNKEFFDCLGEWLWREDAATPGRRGGSQGLRDVPAVQVRGGAGARGQVGLHSPLRGREVRARGHLQHPPAVDTEGLWHTHLPVRPGAPPEDHYGAGLELSIYILFIGFQNSIIQCINPQDLWLSNAHH